MVSEQIEARGVRDARVLAAMRKVPRHRFVPNAERAQAYADRPLPIGHRQTISQPYIVALMSELAGVKPGDTVLKVGTGSGYQAAVLAEMGVKVFSIEIIKPLAKQAKATLDELGYGKRVTVRHGDGYAGWPERAPFDAVVVTAAPPRIPGPLKQQLKVGGRLVIPVGKYFQSLLRVTRTKDGFREESVIPVRFVPMTGKAQE
jgi:protein-L-isoaspartate(D-aspartate) O-methyltransferase